MPNDELTILVPILNRPHRIKWVQDQFKGFNVLFLPDQNDHDSIRELERLGATYEIAPTVEEWGCATYASKVNHAYRVTSSPYLMYASDNVSPKPGWWRIAKQRLDANPHIGLLGTNDCANRFVLRKVLATHGILRRSYIEEYGSASLPDAGPVFWEGYRHWGCDVEASFVARGRAVFAFERNCIVRHHSAGNTPELRDSVYELGQRYVEEDRRRRMQRCPGWPHATQLPSNVVFPESEPVACGDAPLARYADVVQAVMISCVQRSSARRATIPQFERLGVSVAVSLSPCTPAGPKQNNIASVHALNCAYAEGKHCLFLEDDVDVDKELFEWALPEAIRRDRVTYFYMHDKEHRVDGFYGKTVASRIMTGNPIRRDLYQVRRIKELFNTQAVFLPYWFYAPIVERNRLEGTSQSFDVFLTWYLNRSKEPPLVALPHPVQHRNDRTARVGMGRDEKESRSFGVPWFERGENQPVEASNNRVDFRAETSWQYERLLPFWRAVPWENRGTFYVKTRALREMPSSMNVVPLSSMRDDDTRTVIMYLPGASWASSDGSGTNRPLVILGGDEAHARYHDYGYPHLVQPERGQTQSGTNAVGFLVTKQATLARHCRYFPDLARQAIMDAPDTDTAGLVRSDMDARPQNPVRNTVRHIGSAADHIAGSAHEWYRKHQFDIEHRSAITLDRALVIISDDEHILREALSLGKPAFMMTEEGITRFHAETKPATTSLITRFVRELLEGKHE